MFFNFYFVCVSWLATMSLILMGILPNSRDKYVSLFVFVWKMYMIKISRVKDMMIGISRD